MADRAANINSGSAAILAAIRRASVFGEQFRRRPQLRLVLAIDVGEPSRFDTY
jgi:hypothetical protein